MKRDFSLGKPPYAAVEGPPKSSQRSLTLYVRKWYIKMQKLGLYL
jgi:hypothetical protein